MPDQENIDECVDYQGRLAIWDRRYKGIEAVIDAYLGHIGCNGEASPQPACDLLNRLKAFGRGQFDFLRGKLSANQLDPLPTTSTELQEDLSFSGPSYQVPDFILWRICNQVSNDALTIYEAIEQRQMAMQIDPLMFDVADKIAYSANQSLLSVFELRNYSAEDIRFMSYLRRGVSVRILPYVPIVMVSIPPSSAFESRDFISIAHEVAHFYYWYGQTKVDEQDVSIAKYLEDWSSDTIPIFMHWIEEIFADVISVLIAGPIAGYSMQEMERVTVGVDFEKDSGTHPISSIRPYIHAKALQKIGSITGLAELQNAGSSLEARWTKIRENRGSPTNIVPDPHSQSFFAYRSKSHGPNVVDTIKAVSDAVDKVLDLVGNDRVKEQFATNDQGATKAWTAKLANLCTPYAEFDDWFARLLGHLEELPQVTLPVAPEHLWGTLVDDLLEAREIRKPGTDEFLKHTDLTGTLRPEEWVEIMRFAGWTTEGPTGRGH